MDDILAALRGDRDPGLYRVPDGLDIEVLSEFCQEQGLQCFVLEGDRIQDKTTFLETCAQVMKFPDYFGHNWDAFEDCLTDLDWLSGKGYVLLYTQPQVFAKAAPKDWSTLVDILQTAVDDWQETDTPMYVFLSSNSLLSAQIEDL